MRTDLNQRTGRPVVTTTTTYRVLGMSCGHCERAVTAELAKLEGVTMICVDVTAEAVTVRSDHSLDFADVADAVDEAGYELGS